MSLTDFLLARIAEDEREASDLGDREYPEQEPKPGSWWHWVLAESEAKRRIVAMQAENDDLRYSTGFHFKAQMIERVLRVLALPYAHHPDYREEWRP